MIKSTHDQFSDLSVTYPEISRCGYMQLIIDIHSWNKYIAYIHSGGKRSPRPISWMIQSCNTLTYRLIRKNLVINTLSFVINSDDLACDNQLPSTFWRYGGLIVTFANAAKLRDWRRSAFWAVNVFTMWYYLHVSFISYFLVKALQSGNIHCTCP